MKIRLFVWFSVGLLVCACSKDAAVQPENIQTISAFVDSLTTVLKDRDFSKYDNLWVRSSDYFVDLGGNKLREDLPVEETSTRRPKDFQTRFFSGLDHAERMLGEKLNEATLEKIEYRIESGPAATSAGLFQFEVTLFFVRDDKRCRIVQPMCVKTGRGIVIGDELMLLK